MVRSTRSSSMRKSRLNTIETIGERKHSGIPIWKPWFEDMETPYDLGMAHGKEDKMEGRKWRFHSGCLLTTEEYTDYREGYSDGWRSERGPAQF